MNKLSLTIAVTWATAASVARGDTAAKPYTRNVAIVVYENAEPLDWVGPYEVYNDAASIGSVAGVPAFSVYMVSKQAQAVNAQGLQVVPNYTIANAPRPDIVLFPGGPASKVHEDPVFFAWAKRAAEEAEIAQSVCTGAFVLGRAGLLDDLEVTTHYGSIAGLQRAYPQAHVRNGRRFVDNGHVVTTAGISAGIDGSLHVVARLLGRRVAEQVATYMEYRWTPEPFLARDYSYLNPSTDARGRQAQQADLQFESKDYAGAAASYGAILKDDPENRDVWDSLGQTLARLEQHEAAAQALARSLEGASGVHAAHAYVRVAAEYALARRDDDAVAMLQKAFSHGFDNRELLKSDPALGRLASDPRVRQLADRR